MLPTNWFVMLVAVWLLWRFVKNAERLLVANRGRGWRLLLMVGGGVYALPAAARGNRWAMPVVLLAVDAAVRLLPALRRFPRIWRQPAAADVAGANVIPLRVR